MKNGFLLSRLLLLDLMSHMDRCLKDADMDGMNPDKWLGRCIKRASRGAVDCFDEEEVTIKYNMLFPIVIDALLLILVY